MTLLTECQSAAIRLVGRKPTTFASSTETFEMEIVDLATEVGRDIADSHDWQTLGRIASFVGDGVTDVYPAPTDYRRMPLHADVINASGMGYGRITDVNEFLAMRSSGVGGGIGMPGGWTLYGGMFQFYPVIPDGAVAEFPYISGNFAADEFDVPKNAFTADTDVFLLVGKLLRLGIIWRWRQNKRLDHGEDEANFTKAFNEISGRDKGSRIFATGPMRMPGNVSVAYPWALGP